MTQKEFEDIVVPFVTGYIERFDSMTPEEQRTAIGRPDMLRFEPGTYAVTGILYPEYLAEQEEWQELSEAAAAAEGDENQDRFRIKLSHRPIYRSLHSLVNRHVHAAPGARADLRAIAAIYKELGEIADNI